MKPLGSVGAFARALVCVTLSTLVAWTPVLAYAQPPLDVQSDGASSDPPHEEPELELTAEERALLENESVPAGVVDSEALAAEAARRLERTRSGDATALSLPGGESRSAISTQALSLPSGEASIEGMGESFAPVLSSGTATYSIPIAVAPGRAGVQPSLSLTYSSSSGNGPVGIGWTMGVPFIARQTDRGLPRYVDRAAYHREEDRFVYNGGQELVPVSSSDIARVDAVGYDSGATAAVPSDVLAWQQYRARVEGGFMRFFRAPPDSRGQVTRWVVQSKDGTRFDFGLLPTGPADLDSVASLEVDDETGVRVFRWMLTRMSDPHGSTVYYRYESQGGRAYLSSIYYVSPASCAGDPEHARDCSEPLSAFGARVRLVYETRDDQFTTYVSGYPVTTARRLRRVEVTAYNDSAGQRTLVRRYHLGYQSGSYHSLLASLQVEGRPNTTGGEATRVGADVGERSVLEGALGDANVGPRLPPITFGYSSLPTGPGAIAGFGALSATIRMLDASPPVSVDDGLTDFFDVNSDGLPDVVVTNPARYRTASGSPAVGVFFNGFAGSDAHPGEAGEFSGIVAMPVRADLASILTLSNLNVLPMDIDGDGRADMLHMPRLGGYGWFAATRNADAPGSAAEVSPARQGWRWTYAGVDVPGASLDPRIDLGRDSAHIEIVDVNNDHLADVVRTTGTAMETWLNLGWVPERDAAGRPAGDGRFGSARFDGSRWQLLSSPTTSCVLAAGTPMDFEDTESRLSDMNGDGIVDIVRIRRGRLIWWPGRGVGSYGIGAHDCASGIVDRRYVEMANPPAELNPELDGVHLTDVDGDGATDVIQVRFDSIDVWFNRAGSSFTNRYTVSRTPAAPSFGPHVRVMDIDGSGTLDVVYANGSRWQYVDLLEGTTPRLLTSVDNGLGAVTTIDYESSASDYLSDLSQAASACRDESTGCDRFAWSRVEGAPSERLRLRAPGEAPTGMFHAAGTPVISTVVRRIRTSDRFGVYSSAQVSETQFAYHDGYYEGIEQEFRGFGAADSITVGDASSPSVYTRTWFHQGRRPQEIADDRLAYSDDEALKGREYLTEVFDERGVYLSTAHATLTSRTLANGLDGRPIQYAFVSQSDEVRYDTTHYTPLGTPFALPEVVREDATRTPHPDRSREIRIRGARAVMLRTTYDDVDNLGQVRRQTAHGRVANVPGGILVAEDPAITSVTQPQLINGAAWIWRTQLSYIEGDLTSPGGGDTLRLTQNTYDRDTGDLLASAQSAELPRTYLFGGESSAEGDADELTQSDGTLVASSTFDAWGQATASCVGARLDQGATDDECFRYATVSRAADSHYAQLVDTETASVSRTATVQTLATHGTWDRGLGVLLTATDPNGLMTRVTYDGFGRLTSVTPPAAVQSPATPCPDGVPTTRIAYQLTSSPASAPVSRVITSTQLDCHAALPPLDGTNVPGVALTSIGYVDGLGRVRANLATGPGAAGEGPWTRSALSRLNTKGAVVEAWQTDFFSSTDPSAVLSFPSESFPHTRSIYDAFGRIRVAYAEDGSLTSTSYHALSTDVCDPLDNDPSSMHFGTCTTARTDGHGRLIDQILRNRLDGLSPVQYHRLWTYYRNDGAVLRLTRAQTSTDAQTRPSTPGGATSDTTSTSGRLDLVTRVFVYDSVGRRIGSDDPDTDSRDPEQPSGARSWRYLFNVAGDLIAVRDPRGCGQNFFYDLGGRLLGEQYVSCGEAQPSVAEQPAEQLADAVGQDAFTGPRWVDVRYFYDAEPSWIGAGGDHEPLAEPLPTSHLLGRATGVADRAQRAAVAYDDRGNAVWTARQVALLPSALGLSAATTGARPVVSEASASQGTVTYDADHTYIRTALFDHAGRPTDMALPRDPDWNAGTSSTAPAPLVTGHLTYDARGLPASAELAVGAEVVPVVTAIHYLRDGLVDRIDYGDNTVVRSETTYDERRRPTRMSARRDATGTTGLRAVTAIADQQLVWDAASNLTFLRDLRDPDEWPVGHRPQSVEIHHDSLYRVVSALFDYSAPGDSPTSTSLGSDESTNWRDSAGYGATSSASGSGPNGADPMRPEPAPMITTAPPDRVQSLVWSWDWLGNMTEWTDDAQQFYERSIGEITNGQAVAQRPSALYLAASIDPMNVAQSGWVELDYGNGGNVTAVTVHGQCSGNGAVCSDLGGPDVEARRAHLRTSCSCASEQYYEYRWDELNRISEARRFDRSGGALATGWTFEARQRYRYDGANVRVIKQSFDTSTAGVASTGNRVALYVYPGDFERRGVEVDGAAMTYAPVVEAQASTETQYLVAGARMVWQHDAPPTVGTELDRTHRVTIPVGDLLHTTSASVDLISGELLEVSTYYPNGARETLQVEDSGEGAGGGMPAVPLEPMGFTGKEADEDVGLVYFGERYLIARVGRWASPDPLHVHAGGGGEALNAYHYVEGNLLAARDALGLQVVLPAGFSVPYEVAHPLDAFTYRLAQAYEFLAGGEVTPGAPGTTAIGYTPGRGGVLFGIARASSMRAIPNADRQTRMSAAGEDLGASLVPVLDPAARLATGETASGAPASRAMAGAELAVQIVPLAVEASIAMRAPRPAGAAPDVPHVSVDPSPAPPPPPAPAPPILRGEMFRIARRIHDALPEAARRFFAVAVTRFRNVTGAWEIHVTSSAPLTEAQMAVAREELGESAHIHADGGDLAPTGDSRGDAEARARAIFDRNPGSTDFQTEPSIARCPRCADRTSDMPTPIAGDRSPSTDRGVATRRRARDGL